MKYAKKSLGQNFLIDKNIIKKIIKSVDIVDKNILEIGPGRGELTTVILENNPKSLILIEKDAQLSEELNIKFGSDKRVKIFNKDILKFDIEKISLKNFVVFGNLPYNISSQILVKFIKNKKWPPGYSDLIFMFQKELAQKIFGKFPSKNYGRLSILTNYRLNIIDKFPVSPNCFFPKPKVSSLVLHFKPKKKLMFEIKDIQNLEKITNVLFSNKRKMVNKNLKKLFSLEKLKNVSFLNKKFRPGEIKPETYYKITEQFEKK